MTDLLDVEVDGDIGDDALHRGPAWGVPAAVAVVALLTLIVLARALPPAVFSHQIRGNQRGTQSTTPTLAVNQPPPQESLTDVRVESARAALAAWGRFAASGDLATLAGYFDPDGPQYRLLANEAANGAARLGRGDPYNVTVTNAKVIAQTATEAVLSASAVWERPGEASQTFRWELVLRLEDADHWLVWTLRDKEPQD
jgi:hypothetical protein